MRPIPPVSSTGIRSALSTPPPPANTKANPTFASCPTTPCFLPQSTIGRAARGSRCVTMERTAKPGSPLLSAIPRRPRRFRKCCPTSRWCRNSLAGRPLSESPCRSMILRKGRCCCCCRARRGSARSPRQPTSVSDRNELPNKLSEETFARSTALPSSGYSARPSTGIAPLADGPKASLEQKRRKALAGYFTLAPLCL